MFVDGRLNGGDDGPLDTLYHDGDFNMRRDDMETLIQSRNSRYYYSRGCHSTGNLFNKIFSTASQVRMHTRKFKYYYSRGCHSTGNLLNKIF